MSLQKVLCLEPRKKPLNVLIKAVGNNVTVTLKNRGEYWGRMTRADGYMNMMLKGANAPYAVHIPGFNGFLSTRFFTIPWLWYERIITDMDPRSIKQVVLRYPDSLDVSFDLKVNAPGDFELSRLLTGDLIAANPFRVKQFLLAASKMRYEGAIIPSDPIFGRRDSLEASIPVFEMDIISDAQTINIKAYKIKGPAEAYDPEAEAPEFDQDHLHTILNNDQMVLIQYYALRQVLITADQLSMP